MSLQIKGDLKSTVMDGQVLKMSDNSKDASPC